MIHNRDVVKELEEGSIIAVNHPDKSGIMPQLATVIKLPTEKNLEGVVKIHWLEVKPGQKTARWFRFFEPSHKKDSMSFIQYKNILLYDIVLTKNGALRKESREYLKEQYKLLEDHT